MIKKKSFVKEVAKDIRGYWRSLKPAYSNSHSVREFINLIWLFDKVRPYSLVLPARLGALYQLCVEIDRRLVPGDIVECGTCNGGSAGVLGYASRQSWRSRDLWLLDSFQGLPAPTEEDGAKAQDCHGAWRGSEESVREILKALEIQDTRLHIIEGWFQETLSAVQVEKIALLHIDADLYTSVKLCLDGFYDRVEPGGFVVLDDYGSWEGCRKAFEEFVSQRELNVDLVRVDNGGRYFEKPRQQ